MSNTVTSEYMDYEGLKTTMNDLNEVFTQYEEKLGSINDRIASDINAGSDCALDSTLLGANAILSWDDLSFKFKNFKETFDVIYNGVVKASNADEAFETLAKLTFNTDGTVVKPESNDSAANVALTNDSYRNMII